MNRARLPVSRVGMWTVDAILGSHVGLAHVMQPLTTQGRIIQHCRVNQGTVRLSFVTPVYPHANDMFLQDTALNGQTFGSAGAPRKTLLKGNVVIRFTGCPKVESGRVFA